MCASGTCDVDMCGSGAITTIWDRFSQVNAAYFAGHNDWRIPPGGGQNSPPTGSDELETILLAPYPCGRSPCIDPIFGPTVANSYRSASTIATLPGFAWGVGFSNGLVYYDGKGGAGDVRAVRPGS